MAASQTGYTLTKNQQLSDISIGGLLRLETFNVAPTASSYYTSGYLITPANVGLSHIYFVIFGTQVPVNGTPITTIVMPFWDATNTALQFFQSTTGAPEALVEVASATDLSGFVFQVTFVGN